MFKLEAQGLELNLRVELIDQLRIHEEIVQELLEELVREIRLSGMVRDPVIVDSNTRVVLDGMHRVAALQKIGCRYLPVCLVDYHNPKVMVGCWYRVIKGGIGKFLDIFKLLGLGVQPSPLEDALQSLEERKATAALLTASACLLLKAPKTEIGESYAWVKRLERTFREEGFSVWYEREPDAEQQVRSGEASAALLVPRVRKEEVLEAARSGNVFAHKTTRHVLPARPVNVGVPLEWLAGGRSLDEVNRWLVESLSKRKLERLPKGSLFEGRRYDEELLVFR
ncbi:MAG: ParB N-terminal domain-containing protein [Candidatus Hodarchaeaceae archaeon]|nr:ParB N-terminal domain-containing protein [Candidatus Hodarchaeaceae archaeon]